MIKITILAFAFFTIFLSLFLLKKERGKILLSIDNLFILFYSVTFGILFPINYFYSVSNKGRTTSYLEIISGYTLTDVVYYYLLIILFIIIFIYSYRRVSSRFKNITNNDFNGSNSNKKAMYASAVLLFLIGLASDFLYLRAYGSYSNYLLYSGMLRSGVMVVNNPFSFLVAFRGCSAIASLVFLNRLIEQRSKTIPNLLLLLLSVFHTFLILYSNKGRLGLIMYILLIPILIYIRKRNVKYIDSKIVFGSLIIGVVFAFLIVGTGILLGRSSETDVFYMLVKETSFVFANFKAVLNKSPDYRYFSDIVAYPLYLLPSSIWRNIMPHTASDICTLVVSGAFKGSDGVYGESPCDLITFGFLQFNIFGVFICAVFFGTFFSYIVCKIKCSKLQSEKAWILVYLSAYLIIQTVFYADSYHIVQRLFPFVVFIILYKLVSLFTPKTVNYGTYKIGMIKNENITNNS